MTASMAESMSALARSLEYWREIRGLSQAQLSQKAGLADSAVNDILRSPDRSPRLLTVEKLAAALDISLSQLLSSPGTTASQGAGANRSPLPSGVVVIGPEGFTKGDRLLISEYSEALNFDAGSALIGVTLGFESIAFGFVPGTPVLIFQVADYANEIVAVADGDFSAVSFRYYAPPWLFGFRGFGEPFHEFAGRPGLTILGAVRTRAHVEAAMGRPFPPVPTEVIHEIPQAS